MHDLVGCGPGHRLQPLGRAGPAFLRHDADDRLRAAQPGGWRTTGTGHDGPAFICRIGYSGYQGGKQYPTAAEDNCVLTPPASAYWSYWHADQGANTWTYSQLGAMLYKPKPGSVDLWIFGATNIEGTQGRPRITPDQLRAHNTRPQGDAGKPASTAKAPALPPGVDTGPAPEGQPKTEPTKTAKPRTEPKHQPKKHSAKPSTSASPTPSPSASASTSGAPTPAVTSNTDTRVVDAAPAADVAHDSGSLLPVAAGLSLVVVVGGAAVFAARRRRRTE